MANSNSQQPKDGRNQPEKDMNAYLTGSIGGFQTASIHTESKNGALNPLELDASISAISHGGMDFEPLPVKPGEHDSHCCGYDDGFARRKKSPPSDKWAALSYLDGYRLGSSDSAYDRPFNAHVRRTLDLYGE